MVASGRGAYESLRRRCAPDSTTTPPGRSSSIMVMYEASGAYTICVRWRKHSDQSSGVGRNATAKLPALECTCKGARRAGDASS